MHLFVFDDAVRKTDLKENIKLNIYDDHILHFFHNDQKLIIDTDLLRDGSSTIVLYSQATDNTYVLYDFRELLEILDMTPKEMLTNLNQKDLCKLINVIMIHLLKFSCLEGKQSYLAILIILLLISIIQ